MTVNEALSLPSVTAKRVASAVQKAAAFAAGTENASLKVSSILFPAVLTIALRRSGAVEPVPSVATIDICR